MDKKQDGTCEATPETEDWDNNAVRAFDVGCAFEATPDTEGWDNNAVRALDVGYIPQELTGGRLSDIPVDVTGPELEARFDR